ncbi:medium-chain fatty acid ethyl ester synthase/esterase 1 [Karstenula rhodostoma CBS 690.94]|uniref:alcohol O-acetyltransferase n=1 Tax=Karstenula rhodostoma CBS 690.94 TaxID=1392251 RepID=A0A9P4PG64_9PLEO|nr:medium-chain fatty acid ethyl ester synthase/esterase 1 [Karstenula rhodostoma CBS 690.94]
MAFLFGHAETSYTHHQTPISLPTKSGSKTSFADLIKSATPPCRLNPLLFNGHLQTMWTAVKDDGPPVYYKRKIYESTHSVYPGQFTVDFVISKDEGLASKVDENLPERTTFYSEGQWATVGSDDKKPMLVCLHGLSGGSHEVYLRQCVAPLTAIGWEACVVNGRGCAMSKITTPRLFNARATWDVRQLVEHLRDLFPNRPLYAVGFSLGANILTNYVAEEGESCVLKAAVACSNPWNLEIANVALQRSWLGLGVYSTVMGGNLKKLYELHRTDLLKAEELDDEKIMKCKYLHEFDRAVQAPSWGYPTETAYYRDAQSADAVVAIKIPFLAINAEDDPISSIEAIPYEEFKQNPYTVLCCTNWGGHLSWFQFGGKRWFADAVVAFFTKLHEEVDVDALPAGKKVEVNGEALTKKYPFFDPCNRRLVLPPK